MKLSRIPGDFVCSLSYSMVNKAGGISGITFQIYSLLWIMWLAFFAVGLLHPVPADIGLYDFASSLMPSGAAAWLPSAVPASLPALLLSFMVLVVLPYLPVHFFWIYEQRAGIKKRRLQGMQVSEALSIECNPPGSAEAGFLCAVSLRVHNPTDTDIGNVWLRWVFPGSFRCESSQYPLGTLAGGSSVNVSMPFLPLQTGKVPLGSVDLYFETGKQKYTKNDIYLGACDIKYSYLSVSANIQESLQLGSAAPLCISLANRLSIPITDMKVKCFFGKGIDPDVDSFSIACMETGCIHKMAINVIPKKAGEISLGHFYIEFRLNNNRCHAGPVGFGVRRILAPEINIRTNMPGALYKGISASIGFIVENRSDEIMCNVSLSSCFSSQIECMVPTVRIDQILPASARYVSLGIRPLTKGKADLGNLNISFEVNNTLCRKEPVMLGVHRID
jgi:hypothetical protein